MVIVFLITYLALYWAYRLYGSLPGDLLHLLPNSVGLLAIMLLLALIVGLANVAIDARKPRPYRSAHEFKGDYLKRMKHYVPMLAVGLFVFYIILSSDRNNFNAGLRELSISIYVYFFMVLTIHFLKELPIFNCKGGLA